MTVSKEDEENLVTKINFLLIDSFEENTKFPSNLWIDVIYHTVEFYNPPLSAKETKGLHYLDVTNAFESAGFINITTEIEYDILTGWFVDDGEVKSVTINGEEKFNSEDAFRPDAKVVITYHTLKKNSPK